MNAAERSETGNMQVAAGQPEALLAGRDRTAQVLGEKQITAEPEYRVEERTVELSADTLPLPIRTTRPSITELA